MVEFLHHRVGEGSGITDWDQAAEFTALQDFGWPVGAIGTDDAEPMMKRLDDDQREAFIVRRQDEHVGRCIMGRWIRHVTGQLDNYARLPELKREIARINTELRAREIAAHEALEKADG